MRFDQAFRNLDSIPKKPHAPFDWFDCAKKGLKWKLVWKPPIPYIHMNVAVWTKNTQNFDNKQQCLGLAVLWLDKCRSLDQKYTNVCHQTRQCYLGLVILWLGECRSLDQKYPKVCHQTHRCLWEGWRNSIELHIFLSVFARIVVERSKVVTSLLYHSCLSNCKVILSEPSWYLFNVNNQNTRSICE